MYNDILDEKVELLGIKQELSIKLVHARYNLKEAVSNLDLSSVTGIQAVDIHVIRTAVSNVLSDIQRVDRELADIDERLENAKTNEIVPAEVTSQLIELNII